MAIKHQLQYSLFSGTYYKNKSGILRRVISDEGIRKMTSALKYIETLTSILQDIEVCTCTVYRYQIQLWLCAV